MKSIFTLIKINKIQISALFELIVRLPPLFLLEKLQDSKDNQIRNCNRVNLLTLDNLPIIRRINFNTNTHDSLIIGLLRAAARDIFL